MKALKQIILFITIKFKYKVINHGILRQSIFTIIGQLIEDQAGVTVPGDGRFTDSGPVSSKTMLIRVCHIVLMTHKGALIAPDASRHWNI